ncbi:MAG TPA: hypothetical protein VJ866_14730 [Pyrinomonadaceae bacterium]|nr:hypothetical protein [Pyrinomonadaceae bacterium]
MANDRLKPKILVLYDHASRDALGYLPLRWDREAGGDDSNGEEFEVGEVGWWGADFKGYSAVCLCLHGPHNRESEFREFAAKCGEAGALAIGVADATYYSSEEVIPAVEGLLRCSSRDLLSFLRSHLPQT